VAVLAHNGTPSSRHLYGPAVADAAARGIRLIGYDRPGYGGSTPQPGRAVADCVADVRAICAALGIDRLLTWGISGGGPHVLACAALAPDLVAAAASLASPAPYPADGLDWLAGMGQDNVDDFRLMLTDEQAARERIEQERDEILAATASDQAKMLESLLTPTDAAALTPELTDYLTRCGHDGLAPGAAGFWADSCALTRPWGFSPADAAVPVLLLHGREDMFVPLRHGQWLAARIPGVTARLLDHDGHLTLLQNRVGEVHSWLLGQL
jgi:pimeloyl-ACP methyl ester carboxylesterase